MVNEGQAVWSMLVRMVNAGAVWSNVGPYAQCRAVCSLQGRAGPYAHCRASGPYGQCRA